MIKESDRYDQYPPRISERVFGIGMKKTGTSSLKKCFARLDLHPIAPGSSKSAQVKRIKQSVQENNDYAPALSFAEKYKSFQDSPWNLWDMYRHLDRRFPDSFFILTVRDSGRWWRSVERWVTFMKPWMVERYCLHLRVDKFEKTKMIRAYEHYNQDVIKYFGGRDNLLTVDLEQGDGWEPICNFLHCPIPQEPFPHVNRQTYDERDMERKKKKAARRKKQIIKEIKRKINDTLRLHRFFPD